MPVYRLILVVLISGFASLLSAQEVSPRSFQFAPKVITVMPIFFGGGADMVLRDRFHLGLSMGFTPSMYSASIGQVAARIGGNDSYKDVIESAYQNNFIWRANVHYNFTSKTEGWLVGFAFSRLSSSGTAPIGSVLQAATGRDYSQLINLLAAAGRNTEVDMESTIMIGEIYAGYVWELAPNFGLTTTLGIGKVLTSDILLETGLPNFENSDVGNSLLRSTEQELETIVIEHGLSPALGISASYAF